MNTSFFAKVAGSALIAVSMFAAASASAATTVLNFNGESASFSATYGPGVASFSDDFLFNVPAASTSDPVGTITLSATKVGKFLVPTINNTSLSFFKINADNSHTALDTTYDANGFYLASVLPTGMYGFNFAGNIKNVAKGGSYGGTLTMNVSAVPEPGTYAMLVAGLGLLAFTARRKASK
ncbi:hypothetical protein ACFDR9_001011 [Janthinobacterium sp. CG_23.3]|uniref:FxDxF family PEP-CTERM protein n=1 Tax=unclassified Janthinobacterium TaxID=2610881 RepID=UPI0018DEE900|nr:FxDxF family PEP-CTERM protein [Janthinobacterium sp. CG3]